MLHSVTCGTSSPPAWSASMDAELRRKAWSAKKGVLHVRFRSRGKVTHLGVIDRAVCKRH